MTDELVPLASYGSRLEAELVVQQLESAGIDAVLASDSAGGMVPSLSAMGAGPSVMVRADDVAAAEAVLNETEDDD